MTAALAQARRLALATAVRDNRRLLALTQEQLAERVGCSLNTVNRIEGGRISPTVHRLHELADALGVRAADLLVQPAAPGSGVLQ